MINFIRKPKRKSKHSDIFFVRGFQRSGTNWVCNLLNHHPEINCKGEFHFENLYHAYKYTTERKHGLLSRNKDHLTNQFYELIESVIKEECKHSFLCGDRTPIAIQDCVIPGKAYIIIHREPRDILISWIYHLFRMDHDFGKEMNAKKEVFKKNKDYFEVKKSKLVNDHWIKKMAKQWQKRISNDFATMHDIDKSEIPIRYYYIKYEELLENTEQIRTELYSFLNVNPKDASTLTSKTKPGFDKHNPNSHYRMGKAQRWQEYLTTEQNELFLEHVGNGLSMFNDSLSTFKKTQIEQ